MRIESANFPVPERGSGVVVIPVNVPVIFDTTGGPMSVSLPDGKGLERPPREGDYVLVIDEKGTFKSKPLTILGLGGDLVVDVDFVSLTLLFDGSKWNLLPGMTHVPLKAGPGDLPDPGFEDADLEENVAKMVSRTLEKNLGFIGE